MTDPALLPGVPAAHVLQRLAEAGGDEIASGKFASADSSAALAVNAFGWFIPRPELLPPLPGLAHAGTATLVDVEYCARFPWSGGRHPWLDAMVQTPSVLAGVESKRFEPFRDRKNVSFSGAYDRDVWGPNMKRYTAMRERLCKGDIGFRHLDAAQLVKHAYGLVTAARRRDLAPVLFYIFAEPAMRDGKPIGSDALARHREEIVRFAGEVAGDEVAFLSASYREWFDLWPGTSPELLAHRAALTERFAP